MSNPRYPHPNGHHDHDLRPDRRADASATEADALDALLNEIAQGNGAPNPRSSAGDRQERPRPDVRTETGGQDSLPAARAFHRRVETAERRDPGSTALDPHLWESIMTASSSAAREANPARGALRRTATQSARQSPPPTRSRSRNHVPDRHQPGRWAPVANATLALIILLAGFGVWRVYDGLNGAGPIEPDGRIPGLAVQPGTPEPTKPPVVAAAPVATPAPISACDFGADIPIFPGVDASPIDGTTLAALLLTTSGDLVLTCPEEPEPIVLASGIEQAGPGGWPGVVHTSSGGASDGDLQVAYVNIVSGEVHEIGPYGAGQTFGTDDLVDSPWLVAPSAAAPDQWQVTDLRTMESRMLSDLVGAPWPEGANVLIAEGPANRTLAIAPYTPYQADLDRDPGGAIIQDGALPGDVMMIDGTLDETRWINLPPSLPYREMTLSPDGEHLALRGDNGELFPADRETVYSVVQSADGSEVGRSEPLRITDHTLGMTWAQEGKAFLFLQESSMMSIAMDGDGIPETLLDVPDGLATVRTTYDPDVVTVRRNQAEEVATETPGLVQPRIYSVNTVTGDVMEFDGVAVRDGFGWAQPPSRFLVMSDESVTTDEPATYRVIDPVTGEEYGTLADVELGELLGDPSLGVQSLVQAEDGHTEVIGFGASHLYLTQWLDGEMDIRQIASPPGLAETYNGSVSLTLSSDGAMLSLTIDGDESQTRWLLPLDGEPDDWIEIPTTVASKGPASVFFIPGTGD